MPRLPFWPGWGPSMICAGCAAGVPRSVPPVEQPIRPYRQRRGKPEEATALRGRLQGAGAG